MKKVLKKLISIMLIIILLGSFEAPSIFQTVYAVSEIVARDAERGDIFQNVFSIDDLENIMPFSLENFRDNLTRDYIIGEFENAGKTITNKDELPELIGTGTEIKTFFETYTILVYGDVDGNGRVTVADAEKASRHAIRKGEYTLTGVYALAANVVNTDENITMGDAEYIFRFAMGRINTIPSTTPVYPTPTPTPTTPPDPVGPPVTPTVRLNVTAELEPKDIYYYVDEHKITVRATRQDNGNTYNVTSASATIKKDGKTVSSTEAKITKIGKQDDGSYVLGFVAQTPGTYTITVKVSSDTATFDIEIKENTIVSNVVFGDGLESLTLTTGQKKTIPLTFTNAQGKKVILESLPMIQTSEMTEAISVSTNGENLIITGKTATEPIIISVLYKGEVVGAIPVNVVDVINTIETTVTSTEADGKFIKEEQYPITVKLNGNVEKIAQEKIKWTVYDAKTNRITSNAKVLPAETDGEYYFKATATGSYKVIATIPKEDLQEEVKEELSTKTAIEVVDNEAVNKVLINNKITVAEGATSGTIEVYNTQDAQILPMKFYHKYSSGEITVNEVAIEDLQFELSSGEVAVEGRKAQGEAGNTTDKLETLYIKGTEQGENNVTVTVKYKNTVIGTFTVSVVNPTIEVKAVKTTTPIEMYLGAAPKRTDLFIKTETDEATGKTKTYTYTLFNITKLNKNGTKLSAIDYSEIDKFVIGITDGTKTLDSAQIDVIGLKGTTTMTEVTSGEITRIGIRIADEPVNNTIDENTLNEIIASLRENNGTLTIGYEGLKTKEGNDQYEFNSIKIAKLITEVNSSITPETNGKYYKEARYKVNVTYGKGEGPAEKLDWIINKNGSSTITKDATVELDETTGEYYFVAKATGTYKVRARVLASGSQAKVDEITANEITVEESVAINKVTIGSGNSQVTIAPNEAGTPVTTGSLEVYNGYPQTLEMHFYHQYPSGASTEIKKETTGADVVNSDITLSYVNTQVTIEGRDENGDPLEADADKFKSLYVKGENKGETTTPVELTLYTGGKIIGTVQVIVVDPRLEVTTLREPAEMYVGYDVAKYEKGYLQTTDLGTHTLFKVNKVKKDGSILGQIDLADIGNFNVEISDGQKTLTSENGEIDCSYAFDSNGEIAGEGAMTYIGANIFPSSDEATIAIINNLKTSGTIRISYGNLQAYGKEEIPIKVMN